MHSKELRGSLSTVRNITMQIDCYLDDWERAFAANDRVQAARLAERIRIAEGHLKTLTERIYNAH